MDPSALPVAVRAWMPRVRESHAPRRDLLAADPRVVLVFDTETTIEASQRLTFGSWQVYAVADYTDELEGTAVWRDYLLVDEGLFHADDLAESDRPGLHELRSYIVDRPNVRLISRSEWIERVFYPMAARARALVVGFNLPFDLSRVAERVTRSTRHPRGFSFVLSSYEAGDRSRREDTYRQRVGIESVDSKRAFIEFMSARDVAAVDLVPDEPGEDPDEKYTYRGRFLDLRTLCFALTDRSHSLASACEAFAVEHPKGRAERHGEITQEYIDYNRQDVRATWELYCKVREEYELHPIALSPTKAYSPASIGKSYLEAMGIKPVLDRQPDFPPEVLGQAMVAYYGGRAECRIRRAPVPVVYLDFLSMYPTVNTLMGNWRPLIAREIRVEPALEGVREFVQQVELEDLFTPKTWEELACLVLVQPDSDVLPTRAKYDNTGEWQIGVNPLTSPRPLWYTLADVVAAKLLSGEAAKVPVILDAVRLVPSRARQRGLKPIRLRGSQEVHAGTDDFFQRVIELRRGSEIRELPEHEQERLSDFLKVLANSASYGVFAEMNRQDKPATVERFGLDVQRVEVAAPEEPGRWCFPPLAAFIAGGARLMLAMLERCVADLGGSYAFCDTDSMAIVATEPGGKVAMPRGGRRSLHALSWSEVDTVIERFEQLKPYGSDVKAKLLKAEDENFEETETGQLNQRQLFCYAISAKRYCLHTLDSEGQPTIRKFSESGLGHLLDPTDDEHEPTVSDPDSSVAETPQHGRGWIRRFWEDTLTEVYGQRAPRREWVQRPALSQFTVSTPALLAHFAKTNDGLSYAASVKPFNFMLIAHDASEGPNRKVLVAPYERDPAKWLALPWRDRGDGEQYPVSLRESAGGRHAVRITTYRREFQDHSVHLEAKSLAPDGRPTRKLTAGLLLRRPVVALNVEHIGKEANRLDEVAAGLLGAATDVYTVYEDPWPLARQVLAAVTIARAMRFAGLGRSATMELRAGRTRSSRRHRTEMVQEIAGWCRDELARSGVTELLTDFEALAAWLEFAKRSS